MTGFDSDLDLRAVARYATRYPRRVHVALSEETHAALVALAQRRTGSVAEATRIVLEAALAEERLVAQVRNAPLGHRRSRRPVT